MITIFKYFHEKTDNDFNNYTNLWKEHLSRFIFLYLNLPLYKQLKSIKEDILHYPLKDILVIRFPCNKELIKNKIINSIMLGKGINYENNKIWFPKEVWIYDPINE